MKRIFHNDFKDYNNKLDAIINGFETSGILLGGGERNVLKQFSLNSIKVNVKAFKIPNLFNQIVYKYFRKSKAQRSFEYANVLLDKGIGTPQPIAYYEFPKLLLFKKSFYLSQHINYDLTYRELTKDLNNPEHEKILRAFTQFTYKLHKNHIYFLDHSPGNTLIKNSDKGYEFYLVDLNRMIFRPMTFEIRIRNFERLTIHKSMVEIMSEEYSKCSGEDFSIIFKLMWKSTQEFQEKFHRKRRLKKQLKFWK